MSLEDNETIDLLRKKYKFLKGLSNEEIMEKYLYRCENCFKVCFSDDLVPVMNLVGKVYKCCENCQKTILDKVFYSEEDYKLQKMEDEYYDNL